MEDLNGKKFFKQAELAKRWNCSPGTLINHRKKGLLPYFQLPEGSKILYPVEGILEIERQNTRNNLKTKGGDREKAESKKVKPCVSSSKQEWRI